jgi:hypothetical protein
VLRPLAEEPGKYPYKFVIVQGNWNKRVLSRFYPIETILIFFQQENDTGGGRFFP